MATSSALIDGQGIPSYATFDDRGISPPAVTEEVVANRAFQGQQTKDNYFFSTILDYFCCFSTCFILPERTHVAELLVGKYYGTITEPGCYCRNSCFVEMRRVSTAMMTIQLPNIKVIDARGSPLIVSGIVTFEVVDARKASIDVIDAFRYVKDMAPAILKRVVASFPYESRADAPEETSLRGDTLEIAQILRSSLQTRVNIAGVHIDSFSIDELSYAPEISRAMLKRQQADALVDARRSIVAGAKEIALTTVEDVSHKVKEEDQGKLLANLLVVLVGEQDVTPTLAIGN